MLLTKFIGPSKLRVIDTTTNEDKTKEYVIKSKDGKEVFVISAKKLTIDKTDKYEFYVFHILNTKNKKFDCISTIPSAALKKFLTSLSNNSKYGLMSIYIEEKKLKNEKGLRLYHDFWKAFADAKLIEKLENIEHAECKQMTKIETVSIDDLEIDL